MTKSRLIPLLMIPGFLLIAFDAWAAAKPLLSPVGMERLRLRSVPFATSTRLVAVDASACGVMDKVYQVAKTSRGFALSSVTPTKAMLASDQVVPCVALQAGSTTSTPKAFYFWSEKAGTSTRNLLTY